MNLNMILRLLIANLLAVTGVGACHHGRGASTPSAKLEGGTWITGGGDPLRMHFVKGQEDAQDVLSRLLPESLSGESDPAVKEWIVKHRDALMKEIKESPHDWPEKPTPQVTCAKTENHSAAPITFSFAACRGVVLSPWEAAKVLIHESVHHLGVMDHHFADKVAIAVYRAWEELKLKGIPLCDEIRIHNWRKILGRWAIDYTHSEKLHHASTPPGLEETIEFKEDHSILKDLPGIGRCADGAGYLQIKNAPKNYLSEPTRYVLAEIEGNPAIVYYRQLPDRLDREFMKVHIALADDPKNHLLLVGGDHNDAYSIFVRK